MKPLHSVSGAWEREFEEGLLARWAAGLRSQLQRAPDLGLVFIAPRYFAHAARMLEIIRIHAQTPVLVGCSGAGLIASEREIEENPGLSLGLYALPGAELKVCRFTQENVEEASGPGYWHSETGVTGEQTNGWLVFADPFHLDAARWLHAWNEAYAPVPILGGLASGDFHEQRTQIYLNGEVHEEGGVALSIGGDVALRGVISQGCTPIGETWTITRTDRNIIHQIGNRPAYTVLAETLNALPPAEQEKTKGNLFVGLVVNEYLDEFHRGDFLIRNLIGADPRSGALAVAELPRVGQTIQFQRRDAQAARDDMRELLRRARESAGGKIVYGACLCSCNGRGSRLFGAPHHDPQTLLSALGDMGVAGFFCNGEIGPVGDRSFLHGYTASVALFTER